MMVMVMVVRCVSGGEKCQGMETESSIFFFFFFDVDEMLKK